jgi:hypothetical protein
MQTEVGKVSIYSGTCRALRDTRVLDRLSSITCQRIDQVDVCPLVLEPAIEFMNIPKADEIEEVLITAVELGIVRRRVVLLSQVYCISTCVFGNCGKQKNSYFCIALCSQRLKSR